MKKNWFWSISSLSQESDCCWKQNLGWFFSIFYNTASLSSQFKQTTLHYRWKKLNAFLKQEIPGAAFPSSLLSQGTEESGGPSLLNDHQAGAKHKSLGSRNFASDGQSTAKGETRAHVSNYRTPQLPEEAGPEGVRGRPQRRPGGRMSEVGDRVGGTVEREPSSFSNCHNATVLDYCWATACPEKLLKAPSLKRMFT